uniref:FYVE-type domain-containing protein n=1 Tax=Phytophthora ramorum TaxID=164328 RepID=H3GZN5_PHYRM
MKKDRFTANPFPEVRVSEREQKELISLVDIYVDDYLKKYEHFAVVDKHQVNMRRWEHVKSKDNLHVYTERTRKELQRNGMSPENSLSATQRLQADSVKPDLPVMLSVGSFVGEMDDLMFGVVNPTLDSMRIKASYVHDLDSAAVLHSVLKPSKADPFQSLVIKWMAIDVPLQSTSLVKSRDFVYIEATGVTYLANGDRVGYHLLHSIDFPQTKPLPNKIRGNLSVFSCFKQIDHNIVDNYACGIIDPGNEIIRSFLTSIAAKVMLSATNYVYCGQMKKLSWLLQHHHSAFAREDRKARRKQCVVCGKNTTHAMGSIGRSTCKICYGSVCYSCKIRQRISFIAVGGQLIQRRIVICARCMSESTHWNAQEVARDQVSIYETCASFESRTVYSALSLLETSMSSFDEENWRDV